MIYVEGLLKSDTKSMSFTQMMVFFVKILMAGFSDD